MTIDGKAPIGNDLSWVKQMMQVEYLLDLTHYAQESLSNLRGHVLGPGNPHSVLRGKRSFELPDQGRNLACQLPEFNAVLRQVQIEYRTHVEQSRGGVTVIGGLQPQLPDQ